MEPAPGENRQEQRREYDPTMIDDNDPDLLLEDSMDNLSQVASGDVNPRVKITTSGDEKSLIPFGECLQVLIPNSVFELRQGEPINELRQHAFEEGFTDILILIAVDGKLYSMSHLHLPYGPSAEWRITSVALPKEIPGHARTSAHYPEVILERFETRMGKLCGRMLKSLFPAKPDFRGRRVVQLCHQRDFIFFRHYRYIFESANQARLQEAGPKFTLKLLWLQEGPYDPANGIYTFYRRQKHEKSRLRWWM